jgi:integrase
MKLTAKAVATLTLPAGKTDVIHFDDALPRFGFRIRKGAGGKVLRSWIVQYRHAGQGRRMTLKGVLSAEQARSMAAKLLAKVELGEDPQEAKLDRRHRDANTFRAVVADFLAMKKRELRASSFSDLARYLVNPAYFGPLHALPLDKIGRRDVAARLVAITREHSSIVAAHARTALSGLFGWALAHGLCESNPVIGTLKPQGSRPRERVLSDGELAAIWKACGDDDHGRIIKLLILCGARASEIGGISWPEIDLDRGVWVLPGSRSKNKQPHTLPLLPAMLAVIKDVPRRAGRDLLFGARAAEGFTNWPRDKAWLDQRSGVAENFVVHDIRRSVATKLGDLGIAPHVIEQILNHQSGHKRGPAGIYNRSVYTKEVRNALAAWHDHVRSIVEGSARKIISLPQVVS